MERVKAFVIKYQLWFKLAAIALLVATIFAPFYIMIVGDDIWQNYSIWYYATNNSYIDYVRPLTILYIILALCAIILLTFSIFLKNKIVIITYFISYLIAFILLTVAVSCICTELNSKISTNGYCIPNVAYFISIFLLFTSIFIFKRRTN